MITIGKRLRELRRRRGLSRSSVAYKLDISLTELSAYEDGRKEIDIKTLVTLADLYNATTDYILGRYVVERGCNKYIKVTGMSGDQIEIVEAMIDSIKRVERKRKQC